MNDGKSMIKILNISPVTMIVLIIFFLMSAFIIRQYGYHHHQVNTLIAKAKDLKSDDSFNNPAAATINHTRVLNSEISIVEKEQASLLLSMGQTIFLYLPAAFLILFISFMTAVGAAYNPFSPYARIWQWPILIIDSVPLIFWVIISLLIVFRIFSHAFWGDIFKWFYYPALSFSYGMVLIVVFFKQNKRTIAEIRSQNILNGEIVTGISDLRIIWRMFQYHFAKTIMIRQLTYTILYLLLFDYCLMYIFEGYRQIDCGLTSLTLKAGLYLLRIDRYELLDKPLMTSMYYHLHYSAFYLILALALICFFILFMIFDRKDITND